MSAEARHRDSDGLPSALHVGSETFTRARIERILSLVVGFGCTILGAQAFLNALASEQEAPGWQPWLNIGVYAPLGIMLLACFVGRLVKTTTRIFALVYPLALLLWPVATAGQFETAAGEPWIWYLINVATSASVLAFALPLQMVWAVAMPVMYGVVRVMQLGFPSDRLILVILDVVFAIILAGVVLALGWMLRTVALDMDRTRAEAVRSYAAAAAADAAERERVAVAALMHDSVLAALISAERAVTPRERTLAVSMAREALTRLANADQDSGEGSDEPVAPVQLAAALERAIREVGAAVPVDADIESDAPPVPGRVARALVLASVQAVSNARQHAEGAGLAITFRARGDAVEIRVVDTGPGFDPDTVPEDRLGIRGSIVARMAAVGGSAAVASGESGTAVTLGWRGVS